MRGVSRSVVLVAAVGSVAVALVAPSVAGEVPTPQATRLMERDSAEEVFIGFTAPLPGRSERLGMYVRCERPSGRLRAGMFFGAFPAGKPVQAAVRSGEAPVERFGPVVVGGPGSGFHDPLLVERGDVLRLVAVAFTEGALVSNGHNSIRNRISASENRRAREAVERCAGR